nr:MAG TPA: hypothetical protein [Caudoviricetes sp.]
MLRHLTETRSVIKNIIGVAKRSQHQKRSSMIFLTWRIL